MSAEVSVFADVDALAEQACLEFAAHSAEAIARRGRFVVVLAGGSTPRRLYERVAERSTRERLGWPRTWCIQGDERAVPPEHADSNFRMQNETLLSRVAVPPSQIIRFRAEDLGHSPEAVARQFEYDVRTGLGLAPGGWPVPDLVLLGMGSDGHTASLFPHSPALAEQDRIAVANPLAAAATTRYTLTAEAINRARAVLFLVAGADKSETFARVLSGPRSPAELPAQMIAPRAGSLRWLVDAAAARAYLR